MFQKQIAIILSNFERQREKYEIVSKRHHEQGYRSHYIELLTPAQFDGTDLPPLMELMDRDNYPEYDVIRFKLLKYMIGTLRLRNYDLCTFPRNYLQDILALTFLRHHKLIDCFEADLILLSIKHIESDLMPENFFIPEKLNPKAFRTSFLFSKIHSYIHRCFKVVGLFEFTVRFSSRLL